MDPQKPRLWKQLGWMAGLWLASVLALGTLSLIIRTWLKL
jgi:hypothetical protein